MRVVQCAESNTQKFSTHIPTVAEAFTSSAAIACEDSLSFQAIGMSGHCKPAASIDFATIAAVIVDAFAFKLLAAS